MVVNCPCVPDEAAPGPFGVVFLWLLGMADPHQGHRESEQTGRGVTARCPRLSRAQQTLCCWGLLLPWGEAPAPGAVMGNVRVGVSLPSRAGQTLLQPLNCALELPPRAFVSCWAVCGIACVCLCFGITPEGLSLHLTPRRAKNGVCTKQLAPAAVCWVGTDDVPFVCGRDAAPLL